MKIEKFNNVYFTKKAGKSKFISKNTYVSKAEKRRENGLLVLGAFASGAAITALLMNKKQNNITNPFKKFAGLKDVVSEKAKKAAHSISSLFNKKIKTNKTVDVPMDKTVNKATEESSIKLSNAAGENPVKKVVEINNVKPVESSTVEQKTQSITKTVENNIVKSTDNLESIQKNKITVQKDKLNSEIVTDVPDTTNKISTEKNKVNLDNSYKNDSDLQNIKNLNNVDTKNAPVNKNTSDSASGTKGVVNSANSGASKVVRISEEKLIANQRINLPYMKKVINNNPQMYGDFGVDETILKEFSKLDPDMVKKMNDDDFLSILLAPEDKISASYAELADDSVYRNALSYKLDNGILKNTKSAKAKRAKSRKIAFNRAANGITSTSTRIERIGKLGTIFTVDEMSQIFSDKSKNARMSLLKWLMEYSNTCRDNKVHDRVMRWFK